MIKKIFLITTEASADILGYKLLSTFSKNKNIKFYGIGGENLSRCKNFKKLFDIKLFSVMGFFEILKNIKTIIKNINNIKKAILKIKPDMIITIDGSSLAKHIIKWVKNNDLNFNQPKCVHYVAPQVWAWRENRAKTFANLFDKILCFFDFETKFFLKYNPYIKCPVIGYAHIENIKGNKEKFLKKYPHAKYKTIIAILPGSRKNEVKNMLSIYKEVVEKIYSKNQNVVFFLPTVHFLKKYIKNIIKFWNVKYRPYIIDSSEKYDLFASTYFALSTSGTVVSELSFFNIPTIVSYKFNFLTAILAKIFLKIKFASLINILNDKMIQIELLQCNANSINIFNNSMEILQNKYLYKNLKKEIQKGMKKLISTKKELKPSKIAHKEIISLIYQ